MSARSGSRIGSKNSVTSQDQHRVLIARAMETFRLFDLNKDGTIDFSELRMLLQELDDTWSDERVEYLLRAADINKDKRIQFQEFLRWTFAAEGEEQPDFREDLGLDDIVQHQVTVIIHSEDGTIIFGPEDLMGSISVSHLRLRLSSETERPVGCLCSGDCILRDSMELGVYATDTVLELTCVEDVFSVLRENCISELMDLGALAPFLGKRCFRIGWGLQIRQAQDGQMRLGQDHGEMLLLPDGIILAKSYLYRGCAKPEESSRLWKYEIAEGTFSIRDPVECFIEIYWRRWAESKAYDENADNPPDKDLLLGWEDKEVTESNFPTNLLPKEIGHGNVLQIARDLLKDYTPGRYLDADDDPLAGLPMPRIDNAALIRLGMDTSHVDYWLHGEKHGGPEAFSGRKRRTSGAR